MHITKSNKWLNCLLVLILIISGMRFETIKTDSSSLCAANSPKTCSIYESANTDVTQDICTPEQINPILLRSTVEQIGRNLAGLKSKTCFRTGIFLFTLNVLSENSNFYFIDEYNKASRTLSCGEAALISYIHQQDGAKG